MNLATIISQDLLDECEQLFDMFSPTFLVDSAQHCMLHIIKHHPELLSEKFDLCTIKHFISLKF